MNEYLVFKLKEGRINKGLKQNDVTKYTGIKNTTLSNYENGITEPDIDTFLQLCELYELNYADILAEAYGLGIQGEAFKIKPSEIDYVKKYRSLDSYGKETVSYILDRETKRVEKLQNQAHRIKELESTSIQEDVHNPNMRLINYYYRLASAGTGQIVFDMPPTKKIEIPDIPEYKKVDYAIVVNGNSMEPVYYDGDTLLIEMSEEIEIGQIGIFLVDNESYVKKLGNGELISLNPEYDNIPLDENSRCMGKVVNKL